MQFHECGLISLGAPASCRHTMVGKDRMPAGRQRSPWQFARTPSHRFAVSIVALLAVVFLLSPAHAALSFPPLTGRVVDDAGILSPDTRSRLDQTLAAEEKQTSNQIVVVTLKSLDGASIEDYGYQLGRAWGIGQKGKDNGALIIVVPSAHQVRIEVGYGLEGQLTDAQTRIIIERYMVPAFKRGDYDGGVLAGTQAVLQLLGGVALSTPQYPADDQDQGDGGSSGLGLLVFLFILLVCGRFIWPLFFLGGFGGGGWGGGYGGGFGGGGFGGGGYGGGSFGGGGFSGGGGSFGGGGASGSW